MPKFMKFSCAVCPNTVIIGFRKFGAKKAYLVVFVVNVGFGQSGTVMPKKWLFLKDVSMNGCL